MTDEDIIFIQRKTENVILINDESFHKADIARDLILLNIHMYMHLAHT